MNGLPFQIRGKILLHRHYWIFSIFGFAALLGWIFLSKSSPDPTVVASAITGILSFSFFIQKQKLEELKLFTDLFREFNKRYGRLNDKLSALAKFPDDHELTEEETNLLFDYFNLCAEEYFYFKRGLIPIEVWESWINGMKEYYTRRAIQELWDKELTQQSYYGFSISNAVAI